MSAARHDSPIQGAMDPHRVLVVGGSYGGLAFIVNFLDLVDGKPCRPSHVPLPDFSAKTSMRGVQVTLLDERDGFFHTVGAPLAHTSKKHVVPFWKEFSALKELNHPSLEVTRGRIVNIDPDVKIATYSQSITEEATHYEYDYIVNSTGLSRHWPIVPSSHTKDGYVKDALEHVSHLEASKRVVVVGGGAVGIEVAGELKVNNPAIEVTLVHSRDKLLSNEPLPVEFKDRAHLILKEEGVEVILGQRATVSIGHDGKSKIVTLSDGNIIEADAVVEAIAKCPPNTQHLPNEILDAEGYVKITPQLNFPAKTPNNASHFAIGDIVAWPGIKRAGGAMFMGAIAAANVWAQILESEDSTAEFKRVEFPVYPAVMGLAVGKQAIGYGGPGTELEYGTKTMADLFGPDLAWTSLLKYMKLSDVRDETCECTTEAE